MKKMKSLFNPRLLLGVVFMVAITSVFAQSVKDTRTWSRSFSVNTETTLEVENKYGTILIVPWSYDSVQVTADIFLEAKNYARLRKLSNDVSISATGTRTYVIVRTVIGDGSTRIASELRTLSSTLGSNSKVEINYTIYLPEYINIVLSNKFGDIYIDDIYGDVDIMLSNGVLKANTFSGNSNLDLQFAKGSIRNLGTASLKLSYGELSLGKVDQMDFTGKSSELRIDTSGVVKIDSRRDRIEIGEVEYLYGESSFTDVVVKNFIREANCNMKYGTLRMEKVQPDFSTIDLESDFTDITLYISPESNYFVDILHHKDAILNLPRSDDGLVTRNTGEEFFTTEGYVSGKDTDKRLIIKADHKCYINISTR